MTRLGILVVSLAFLAVSAGARAEQAADWAVVCDNSDPAAVSHCYLSLLAGSIGKGDWLGIAVQRLNGAHEVQVTGAGESFGRAEINVQGDTIIVTDYCYDSYCVFVQADEHLALRRPRRGRRQGTRDAYRLHQGSPDVSGAHRRVGPHRRLRVRRPVLATIFVDTAAATP
jgi:hypothetical protein